MKNTEYCYPEKWVQVKTAMVKMLLQFNNNESSFRYDIDAAIYWHCFYARYHLNWESLEYKMYGDIMTSCDYLLETTAHENIMQTRANSLAVKMHDYLYHNFNLENVEVLS